MLTYLRQDTIYEAFAKGWRVISINIRAIYVMANANIMNIATSHIFGLDDVIPRKTLIAEEPSIRLVPLHKREYLETACRPISP